MKRFLICGSVATILLVASMALAQSGPSVVGSWDIVTKTPGGDRPSMMVVRQDGGKLAAVAKSAQGERPYDSIALTGSDIKFVLTIQFQGSDMVLTYTGKVDKDGMKGDVDFGGLAQGEWSAMPHKEMAAGSGGGTGTGAGTGTGSGSGASSGNISGVWNVTVETPNGSGNPVFTIKQDGEKLTGGYKGAFGEAPITGTLKGNDITFSFKATVQDQTLEITYTGKVEGNSMKGKAKLGEMGEGTWTGKKQ